MAKNPNNKTHFTLIEQRPAIRTAVLKGIEYGLSYQNIADSVGVRPETLGIWLKRCRKVEQKFKDLGLDEEQIAYLSGLNRQLETRRQELDKKWGRNVISLVIKHKFFLKLAQDLKGAEAKAEARMLGVTPKGLDLEPYKKAESEARKKKIGMWGLGKDYVSPMEWRRGVRK